MSSINTNPLEQAARMDGRREARVEGRAQDAAPEQASGAA